MILALRAPPSVEEIRQAVTRRAARYGLRLAVLFGSMARKATTEHSDVDLALLADGPIDVDRLYDELAEELRFDAVDVVDLFTAPALLAFHALRQCVPLFEDRPERYSACLNLSARMSSDSAWTDRFKEAYIDRILERLRT